jgi:hypothetical protein
MNYFSPQEFIGVWPGGDALMCGIVGLYLKDDALQPELGRRLTPMLIEMTDRGPDSAGFAVYRNGAPQGWSKLTLFHPAADYDWDGLGRGLADALDTECDGFQRASHFVLMTPASAEAARRWIGEPPASAWSRFRAPTRSAILAWRPRAPSPRSTPIPFPPGATSAWCTTARCPTITA